MAGKLLATPDPRIQGTGCRGSGRGDIHEASQRATGEIHGANMSQRERPRIGLGANPRNEHTLENAAAHVATDHEGEATEHLPLGYISTPRKVATNSFNEIFVVGHRAP